jgi:LCP family protein required for cell wall assembly
MDRSRLKRPEIKTQRQTPKNTFGNPQPVPRALSGRTQMARPLLYNSNGARASVRPLQTHAIRPLQPLPQQSSPNPLLQTPHQAPQKVMMQPAPPLQVASIPPANRIPMDMSLPGVDSPMHEIRLLRRKKWQKARLIATRGMALVLVLLITLGGLLFSQSYFKLNKVFKGTTGTVAALKANVTPDSLKTEGSGRINVLLLGRGGGNHDGPDLTDSMMLASIDPVNYTTTLISIPRDLWVNVPNAGVMKINAAWETGEFKFLGKIAPGSTNPGAITAGFKLVDQTVGQVLGINVDYNVMVNFQAFQQAVDTVGGVTVNVPTALVDPTMAWQNNNNPVLAPAGVQNFDGAQALLYVRSRETTSDFARAARQRAVLVALKGKIETLGTLSNPLKISGLINAFGNNVQTDLSLSNASRLYGIIKNVNDTKVSSIGFDAAPNQYVTTGNIAGQSIVLPTAGLFNYSGIQQYTRTLLKDPYIIKENAKIIVLNGTDQPGLATNMVSELKSYGYNVIGAANTPSPDWTQTTLVNLTHGKDPFTQHYLEQRLGVKAVDHLSDNTIPTNGADFAIIIGSNEVNSTQTQTN